ncbi:MAG: acetyl-CoA carboxylase [Actinobacteria bacterium]|nr:acetyl-CoA carboxylase [Actinomycetota bacterium]
MTHPMLDDGTFVAHDDGLTSGDPLAWPGYEAALGRARERSGSDESVVGGRATIAGAAVEVALFDFSFLGGSVGEVAGERIARAMERAAASGRPFVLATATGGARMQEGMVSLVQMPKLVAARRALSRAAVPYIAVLGNPTTGGILASIGSLADYTIAEEEATIGFTGPRLVERFTGRSLSETSHTAASALTAGLVDTVQPREVVKERVAEVLNVLRPDKPEDLGRPFGAGPRRGGHDAVWSVGHPTRPSTRELVEGAVDDLVPLHGDRAGTVAAGYTAFGRIAGRRCMVLATDSKYAPRPGDLRKARRCLEIAERLRLPVMSVIDTPGADPSEASEAAGIASEIARLFDAMLSLTVPVVSVVTGEGGSGAALAFATADALLIYEDAFFSVIGPESAAEILWRDAKRADEAASLLKLTAHDLADLGIADGVLAAPPTPQSLRTAVAYHLGLLGPPSEDRIRQRARRWRTYGQGSEASS